MDFELAEWSSKIEVGLPAIDAQHRQLFDLAATFSGDGDQIRVLKSLAMLTEYVKVHFREEEEMMAACHYPRLAAHRLLHGEFRRMLFDLLENAKRMTPAIHIMVVVVSPTTLPEPPALEAATMAAR